MPEELPQTSPVEPQPIQPLSFVERNNIHPMLFAFGCLFIVLVLYQFVAGTVTVLVIGGTKVTRENVFLTRLLTMAGQILFIFGPTVLFARLLSSRMPDVFPWRVPSVRETIYALLGLVWLQQIFQIYLFFQERIPLPDVLKNILDPIREMMEEMYKGLVTAESVPELAFVLLVVAFVPAIVEELLFRGVIQRTFERMLSPFRAAIVTGIIFGVFHFNPFALLPLIGLGCYFGVLRMRSNSIILAMTAHFLNNALAVIVVYFGMDETKMVTIGDVVQPTTPTVVLQLILFSMLFLLSLMAYWRATSESSDSVDQE
jgi:membrane protease YdiL (CAAX protease family)